METAVFGLGPIQTNCYVVSAGGKAAIIDPAAFPAALDAYIQQKNLKVEYILLTHGHFDHTMGAPAIKKAYGAAILIGDGDAAMLHDAQKNGSAAWGLPYTDVMPDKTVREGESLPLGDTAFSVIETPGHTPGGISYYFAADKALYCGDTLFCGSVGRTDLYGGDSGALENSVVKKLYLLPDTTAVYPGHGMFTSIGAEKEDNDVFRAQ